MKPVDEISAEVYAELYVNGRKVDAEELCCALQRLLNATEPFVPQHWLDDNEQQRELRKAVEAVHAIKAFEV